MLKKTVKYFAGHLYKPLLVKYLSSARTYAYKGIRLTVPPEVFHPGFFFSTKLLLKHVKRLSLKDSSFLELGAGSGLISFFAAREGAGVTATDINPVAVEYLGKNAALNHLPLTIILSDLFCNIPRQTFDIIVVNPPYYRKKPCSYAEYAWYCGENGEYFTGLFEGLRNYMHAGSQAWMVLSEDCDMKMIHGIALRHHWRLNCVYTEKNLIEKNFIIRIDPLPVHTVV